ncbi:unnamed protein product [Amoebophrya sp. A25]|nr:unnamed protein product [Amoebophrya sp. A25]|eukprot:GSA25T00017398001.1
MGKKRSGGNGRRNKGKVLLTEDEARLKDLTKEYHGFQRRLAPLAAHIDIVQTKIARQEQGEVEAKELNHENVDKTGRAPNAPSKFLENSSRLNAVLREYNRLSFCCSIIVEQLTYCYVTATASLRSCYDDTGRVGAGGDCSPCGGGRKQSGSSSSSSSTSTCRKITGVSHLYPRALVAGGYRFPRISSKTMAIVAAALAFGTVVELGSARRRLRGSPPEIGDHTTPKNANVGCFGIVCSPNVATATHSSSSSQVMATENVVKTDDNSLAAAKAGRGGDASKNADRAAGAAAAAAKADVVAASPCVYAPGEHKLALKGHELDDHALMKLLRKVLLSEDNVPVPVTVTIGETVQNLELPASTDWEQLVKGWKFNHADTWTKFMKEHLDEATWRGRLEIPGSLNEKEAKDAGRTGYMRRNEFSTDWKLHRREASIWAVLDKAKKCASSLPDSFAEKALSLKKAYDEGMMEEDRKQELP